MVAKPEFERQYQSSEERIQSNFFGGLNTTAAPLNCPLEDATSMCNMVVNDSGKLEKRQGTDLNYSEITANTGAYMVNMTTGLGYNFVVTKVSTDIKVLEIVNGVASVVSHKQNVFNSTASTVKPQTVRTNEIEPRLIFCTGVNKPVQLRFTERSSSTTASSTSLAFTSAVKFRNASVVASNFVVFENRVRNSNATVSYNAGTQTLTVNNLQNLGAGTKTVDIILITWQWWAEALLWSGDRFWKSSTRFNATSTDRLMAVPNKIISDMTTLGTTYSYYPFVLYKLSNLTSFNRVSNGKPQLADDWYHSDGSLYVYNVNDYCNPSPFYVIFGATSGSTPFPVYFARRREARFRNGTGILGSNLAVYVNSVKSQNLFTGHVLTPAYCDIWLFKDDGSGGIANATGLGDTVKWVGFEGPIQGVPQDARVEMINVEASHIGSNANTTRDDYADGNFVPAYGIGLFADYLNGYYPSDITLFQDRIVLSGFPHLPFTIVASATSDTLTPGNFYMHYQVTDDLDGKDTDPFDLIVNSEPKDYITKIFEWQSHLFVFTRYNLFRAGGSQSSQVLTANSRSVALVSTIGNINRHTVCRTDTNLMYLSDTGLYAVIDRDNTTEYSVSEVSIKIRNEFSITYNRIYDPLAWIGYDPRFKRIYVGLPAENFSYTARSLYVFNTFRNAWSRYEALGGFQLFHADQYIDRQVGLRFGALNALHWDATTKVPNSWGFITFDNGCYCDFRYKLGVITMQRPLLTFTTANYQQIYNLLPTDTNRSAFPVIPFPSVNDLLVKLNGVKLNYGTDWVKLDGTRLYLRTNPGAGKTLTVEPRMPVNESASGQYLYGLSDNTADIPPILPIFDNLVRRDYQNFTFSDGPTSTIILDNSLPAAGTVKVYGLAYPAWFLSPSYTLEYLTKIKRVFHLYLSFDNTPGQSYFTTSDLNLVSGQDPSALVDSPKTRLNGSVIFCNNDDLDGNVQYDLYTFPVLTWDSYQFDTFPSTAQLKNSFLAKVPIEGSATVYQFGIFSYDDATFRVNGYQIASMIQQQGLSYRE